MTGDGRGQEAPQAAEAARAADAGPAAPSVDPAEVARFAALAERWWDRHGAFRALHALNPVRIAYVRDALVAAQHRRAIPPTPRRRSSPSPASGFSMSAAAAA